MTQVFLLVATDGFDYYHPLVVSDDPQKLRDYIQMVVPDMEWEEPERRYTETREDGTFYSIEELEYI